MPEFALPYIQSCRYKGIANFFERRIPNYVLPDVLRCNDGSYVKTVSDWVSKRRGEVLNIFQNEVYGVTLQDKVDARYEILDKNESAIHGLATRVQVRIILKGNNHSIETLLLVYIPNNGESRHPVIFGYNLYGNQSTTTDENVLFSPSSLEVWHRVNKYKRGFVNKRWCIESAINQGYAVATMCYTDICPDSIFYKVYGAYNLFESSECGSSWQTIGL